MPRSSCAWCFLASLLLFVSTSVLAEERAAPARPMVNSRSKPTGIPPVSLTENIGSTTTDSTSPRKIEYQPNWGNGPSLGSILMKMALGTVLVSVVCGGTLWYGRRWLQKTQGVMPVRSGELKLLESARVGGHCFVHLLQVGNQRILAGTDRSGLQSLVPLPESFGNVLDAAVTPPRQEDTASLDSLFGANERGRMVKTDRPPRSSAMPLG